MRPHPGFFSLPQAASWTLLTCVLFTQSYLFCKTYLQPFRYDAVSYHFLAHQLQFSTGIPLLGDGGFRSYGYPLILKPLTHLPLDQFRLAVAVIQCLSFSLLMLWLCALLPGDSTHGPVTISGLLLLLPVFLPYCVVVLSDAVAAVSLQAGLLLLCWQQYSDVAWRRCLGVFAGGFLLSFAAQIRPVYFYFVAAAFLCHLAVVVWTFFRFDKNWRRLLTPLFMLGGCVIVAAPTVVNNFHQEERLSPLPPTGSLFRYHLALGLSLDKWSSYDPPFDQFQKVIQTWSKKGWSVVRSDPNARPLMQETMDEIKAAPGQALRSGLMHLAAGFEKWDVFPYQGMMRTWSRLWIWVFNWIVLCCYVVESTRRGLWSSQADRFFAATQLLLTAFLCATVFVVVPEERFTLAVYPVAIVYTSAIVDRMFQMPRRQQPILQTPTQILTQPADPGF